MTTNGFCSHWRNEDDSLNEHHIPADRSDDLLTVPPYGSTVETVPPLMVRTNEQALLLYTTLPPDSIMLMLPLRRFSLRG